MKKIFVVLMLLVLALSSQAKEIVIAGIYKAGDQTWFIDEGKASEKMVKSMGASKFIYVDAKMDSGTYLSALDNLIVQKVDGVLVCIPDQNLSELTVKKLKAANIPVIAVDDPLIDQKGNKIAPWVGISAYKIGESVGQWAADYVKKENLENDPTAAILFLTMETSSSTAPRTDGQLNMFLKNIPNYPKNKIFKSDYNGETDKGYDAAAAIFISNPNIKKWLVVGANEEGTIGAVRALEQARKDKESTVIGMGGYLAIGEFAKNYSAMKAAPLFSADDIGGQAAKFLMEYIKEGKAIPMETAVDAKFITKDNYKTLN